MTWPRIRDVVLFTGGMVGIGHETLIASAERPTLLMLFAAMIGLPAFLRADESRRNGNGARRADAGDDGK
jgi:hypothetical protein